MAVDIGLDAFVSGANYPWGYTRINKEHPATSAGILTTVELWAYTDIGGLIVGTFYLTGTNKLKCRDSEAIPGTIIAGSRVVKVVTLSVAIGDFIGCYWPDEGRLHYWTGFAGAWYLAGDHITPGDEEVYVFSSGVGFSLGGSFAVVGWTGKISGVTNPAKIMGVDVANIAKVKGVA